MGDSLDTAPRDGTVILACVSKDGENWDWPRIQWGKDTLGNETWVFAETDTELGWLADLPTRWRYMPGGKPRR